MRGQKEWQMGGKRTMTATIWEWLTAIQQQNVQWGCGTETDWDCSRCPWLLLVWSQSQSSIPGTIDPFIYSMNTTQIDLSVKKKKSSIISTHSQKSRGNFSLSPGPQALSSGLGLSPSLSFGSAFSMLISFKQTPPSWRWNGHQPFQLHIPVSQGPHEKELLITSVLKNICTPSLTGPPGVSAHSCAIWGTVWQIIQPIKVWSTWWPMRQRGGDVESGVIQTMWLICEECWEVYLERFSRWCFGFYFSEEKLAYCQISSNLIRWRERRKRSLWACHQATALSSAIVPAFREQDNYWHNLIP